MSPHDVTRDFEHALCVYTGARYAVAVNSCTSALLLAVAWHLRNKKYISFASEKNMAQINEMISDARRRNESVRSEVEIPKRTYVSVPMSIIHAGGRPTFRDEDWRGAYQLKPLPVWDSARHFTFGMYCGKTLGGNGEILDSGGQMLCVSFHWTKTFGSEFRQGGAILHDNEEADVWFRRARFDGRTEGVAPKDDTFDTLGWHCYMDPTTSLRLLEKLALLPKHNEPLPNDDYPDLSLHKAFQ